MIIESGRVVAVDEDGVWLETVRRSTCHSCSAQSGCGHGLLNRVGGGRRHFIKALWGDYTARDIATDDQVEVAVPERALVGGALLVYLLPLLTMLVGMMLASESALLSRGLSADGAAVLGAVLGFILGLAGVRLHALLTRGRSDYQPVVVGHLASHTEGVLARG